MPPKSKTDIQKIIEAIHIINARLANLEKSKGAGIIANDPVMALKFELDALTNDRDDQIEAINAIWDKIKTETNKRTKNMLEKKMIQMENDVIALMKHGQKTQDQYIGLLKKTQRGGSFGEFMANTFQPFWMDFGRHVANKAIDYYAEVPIGTASEKVIDKVIDWTNDYSKNNTQGKHLYAIDDFMQQKEQGFNPSLSELRDNIINEIAPGFFGSGVSTGKRGRPKKGAKIGLLGTTESSKPPKHLREQAQKYMRPEDYV